MIYFQNRNINNFLYVIVCFVTTLLLCYFYNKIIAFVLKVINANFR